MLILGADALKGFPDAVLRSADERKLNQTFANHSGASLAAPVLQKSMAPANDARRAHMRL